MVDERFSRTALMIGNEAVSRLCESKVIVFGIGGVGGQAAEAICRAGVGNITLVDADTVSLSNINRQIIALESTVGRPKVDVMKERMLDISPNTKVNALTLFYGEDTAQSIDLSEYDYVVDAIDTVKSKLLLIEKAVEAKVPIISSMGTGNKLDPTRFEIADISKTSVCPLARVMRTELRKRGIYKGVNVLFSKEEPTGNTVRSESRNAPGSISFVPTAAGLIIASKVIRDLAGL